MTDDQLNNLKSVLADLAAEVAEVTHFTNSDKWFEEISDDIRNI